MGTTTTNLGLYKPAIGETGWGSLVDANFDELDTRPQSSQVFYAHPSGDNANDGLSWEYPKKDIISCYNSITYPDAIEIHFFDGTYVDSANTDRGLWLFTGTDSQGHLPLPAGWQGGKDFRLVGHGGNQHGSNVHYGPVARMLGGSASDRTKPNLWLSGTNTPMRFENIYFAQTAVPARLGIDSADGTDSMASGLSFRNCIFDAANTVGAGPAFEFGYAFWVWFEHCGFSGNRATSTISASTITGGTTARFTTSAAHALQPGDTVYVTGMTPAGYNGTWTVTAKASTTFDADIGTSPGNGTVFGTALPVRNYKRAGIGFDGNLWSNNSGLITLKDCNFNGGGIYYRPSSAGGWGNVILENTTYEGDFQVTPDPPAFHLVKTYGDGLGYINATSSGSIRITNLEMADAYVGTPAVVVDGDFTDPQAVTVMNAVDVEGPATILGTDNTITTAHHRRHRGFYKKNILGRHPASWRTFSAVVAPFTNLAEQDAASWTGTATVTTGQTAPDGTINAALLTSASGVKTVTVYSAARTFGVGDWIIAGVVRKTTGVSSSEPQVTMSATDALFAGFGSAVLTMTDSVWADGAWEFVVTGNYISSVTDFSGTLAMTLGTHLTYPTSYAYPVLIHIAAADANTYESLALIENLHPWPAGQAAGDIGLYPNQNLRIPKGYVDVGVISAPSAPAAGFLRYYGKTSGGVTRLFYKDSGGTEHGPL